MVPADDGRRVQNCCQHEHYASSATGDYGYEVDGASESPTVAAFSPKSVRRLKCLHMKRIAVFVDPHLRDRDCVNDRPRLAARSEAGSGGIHGYRVEPTDASFKQAAALRSTESSTVTCHRGGSTWIPRRQPTCTPRIRRTSMAMTTSTRRSARDEPFRSAQAAHRMPHHVWNGQRMHGHRDLRLRRDERQNRIEHAKLRPTSASSSRRHAPARSREWSSVQRFRRAQPRARNRTRRCLHAARAFAQKVWRVQSHREPIPIATSAASARCGSSRAHRRRGQRPERRSRRRIG